MMFSSRDLKQTINKALQQVEEFIHKAVPAVSHQRTIPRWRNLGKAITPYQYMRPALVPVKNRNGRA